MRAPDFALPRGASGQRRHVGRAGEKAGGEPAGERGRMRGEREGVNSEFRWRKEKEDTRPIQEDGSKNCTPKETSATHGDE